MRILLLFFLGSLTTIFAQTEPYNIGNIYHFESEILKEKRRLNVHLPLNYSKDSTYSVIYVLDGSAHEDFLHIVGLVQYFQLQFAMPDVIVVGIENVDRKRDFTSFPKDTSFLAVIPNAGQSGRFIQFIEMELQPFIGSTFKTNDTRYLIGQSLGGLLAGEILIKKPVLFSHYFIVSPSFWWDNEALLKGAPGDFSAQTSQRDFVYVAVGAEEHIIMRRDAKKLAKLIKNAENVTKRLVYNKLKNEDHATVLHNAIYQGFLNLYPALKQ